MGNDTKTHRLLKGIVTYAIGDFGSKILSFLIVPLYTYYIAPDKMGTYDLLINTIGLLSPVITLQISDAAYRWLVDPREENTPYIRATFQLLLHNALIATLVILAVNRFIPIPYCVYFILTLLSTRALNTIKKLVRGLGNQKLFALSGILYTVSYLSLNVIQIVWMGRGVDALFSSAIIANCLAIILIFLVEHRLWVNIYCRPERERLLKMLRYSTPLVPNLLNWWVINSSDRYIVRCFLGLVSNGILSVAGKFPTALDMVISLFSTSWQDVSIADTDGSTESRNTYYSEIFRTLYRMTLSMLWFFIPMTKAYILLTMEKSYAGAADIVAFYYLGSVFRGFSSFYGVGYLRNGNTKMAFRTSIVAALVNVAVHLSTIRFLGLHAASISTFVAFFVMWLIRQNQNSEELGITIKKGEFMLLLIADVLLSLVMIAVPLRISLVMFAAGGIGFLLYNQKSLKAVCTKLLKR